MRPHNPKLRTGHALLIGLLALLLAGQAVSSKRPIPLPGSTSQIKSPNGYLVLVNIDSDSEPFHSLVLKNLRTGMEKTLQTYSRHITVSWSPGGDSLFVNDFGGSDYSNCLVYTFDGSFTPLDVTEEMRRLRPQDSHLWGNHHIYIQASKWLNDTELLIRVHGYGDIDPKGYRACYVFSLSRTLRPVTR